MAIANDSNKKSTTTPSVSSPKKGKWEWWQIVFLVILIAFALFVVGVVVKNSVSSQPQGFISSYI